MGHVGDADLTGTPVADPTGADTTTDTGTDTGTDSGTDPVIVTDPTPSPVELLANGGFDGDSGWSGNALNIVNGVSRADVEFAGDPWDVNLSGSVELVAGNDLP